MQYFFLTLLLTVTASFAQNEELGEQFAEVYAGDEGSLRYSLQADQNDPSQINSIVIHSEKELLQSTGESQVGSLAVLDEPDYIIPPQMIRLKRQTANGANDAPSWQTAWRQRYERYHQSRGQQKQRKLMPAITQTTEKPATRKPKTSPPLTVRKKTPTTSSPITTTEADEDETEETEAPKRTQSRIVRKKIMRKITTSTTTETPETDAPTTRATTKKVRRTTKRKSTRRTTKAQNKVRRQFSDLDREKADDFNSIRDDDVNQERPVTQKKTQQKSEETGDIHAGSHDIGAMVDDILSDLREKHDKKTTAVWPPVLEMEASWMQEEPDLDPRNSPVLRQMIVDKHNFLRSIVKPAAANMLKMEWSMEAQKQAQYWAEQCQFKHDNGEKRKTSQFKCGQNLARGWPRPLSWNLTQQLWFDERKDFNYDGAPRGMVGHYTQLVWAQSYQVGCGYHDCGTFHHYVCNYCPSGNIDTRKYRPYQKAAKSCEACKGHCDNGLCTNPCPYVNKFGNCPDLEKEFQICTDMSYGLASSCQATCKCQNKIF